MAPPNTLFLASGNVHKIAELTAMLDAALGAGRFRIATPAEFPAIADPEETGATFEENAVIKAVYWADASGMLALADDSGLAVDALGGRPGVLSARYAADNESRNRRVLDEMTGIPDDRRAARFVCVVAIADPDGRIAFERGEVCGKIASAPRGAAGFGYDPIFELTETEHAGKTTAEILPAEKNNISHRGRALAAVLDLLAASLAEGRVAAALKGRP